MKEEHPFDSIRKVLDAIRQETIPMPGHSDPGAIVDCWQSVDDYLSEIEKECSHFAANLCLHPAGDEHGHFYCTEIQSLKSQLKHREEEIKNESTLTEQLHQIAIEKDNEIKKLKEALRNLVNHHDPDGDTFLMEHIDKAKKLL